MHNSKFAALANYQRYVTIDCYINHFSRRLRGWDSGKSAIIAEKPRG